MALLALGINHKSADLALRERIAFVPEQMAGALCRAITEAQLAEVVILSTCNRTEMFVIVDDERHLVEVDSSDLPGRDQVQFTQAHRTLRWLSDYHQVPLTDLQQCSYLYHGEAALRHMIQVSAGLDSMVLGEPQIFGQMKSAFAVAHESKTVGMHLGRIFPHVFSVAKKVRTDTAIGENPVSVAFAAVNLSQHIFSDLSQTRALLIGAGETIELVAKHLADNGVNKMVVANRTLSRASALAVRFGAEAVMLSDIPGQLVNVDIVISSTGSQLPILGKGAVEHALKLRKHRPILMVDIAVPRDIEEQVGELDDIYLYTVDDLTEIIDENMRNRVSEARKADGIIDAGIGDYLQRLRTLDVVATLKAYRNQAESIRDIELEKALRLLEKGGPAEQVLTQMARNLTNKLIHTPSIKMKKASAEGREDMIALTHDLFDLTLESDATSHVTTIEDAQDGATINASKQSKLKH